MVIGIVSLVTAYQNLVQDLPPVQKLEALLDAETGSLLSPTVFYDRTGQEVIAVLENPGIERAYLALPGQAQTAGFPAMSELLPEFFIYTFDPLFWRHPGFNRNQILDPDPHTLAERLVLRFLLTGEAPSKTRALRMRLLAAQMTAQYGREQVLAWYLNYADFGHLAYGVEAAAQLYFGKSAAQTGPAENLMLAAIAGAPALNPLDAPEAALENWHALKERLAAADLISGSVVTQLEPSALSFAPPPPDPDTIANAFIDLVIHQLRMTIGEDVLFRGGLRIITSLDANLQRQLLCTMESVFSPADEINCPMANYIPQPPTQSPQGFSEDAALSAIIQDPQTGQIQALVGDYQKSRGGEGRQILSHDTGSLLTPFIYLSAFQRGMGPGSLVWDVPASIPKTLSGYRLPPEEYLGPMRLRQALAADLLAPAAQLLYQIGFQEIHNSMGMFGIEVDDWENVPYDGGRISPLDLSDAFAVFANEGVDIGVRLEDADSHLSPITWLSVSAESGEMLYENATPALRPVLSESLAYLINHILSDEAIRWDAWGYPNPTEIGRPAGFKLGQTADGRNTWVVGYTPQKVVTLWMNDPQRENLSHPAASLWHGIIQYTLENQPVIGWREPAGVRTLTVCEPSGLLPTPDCPLTVNEIFLQGHEPISSDFLFKTYEINLETGRLATVFTPPAMIMEDVFMEVPAFAEDWAAAVNLPQPPREYDNLQTEQTQETVQLTAPAPFTILSGTAPVMGTASGEGFGYYRLEAGRGLNPDAWIQIGEVNELPVESDVLAQWDTTLLADGLYALRLQVVRTDQQLETAILQVTVDNTPPTVKIIYPSDGAQLTDDDQALLCLVETRDGVGIARVEWLVDGEMVAERTEAPYHFVWGKTPGDHQLTVRVTDLAGNIAVSDTISFNVSIQN